MYLVEAYVTNASLNVNRPFTYLSKQPIPLYCRIKVRFAGSDNVALVSGLFAVEKDKESLEEELGYTLQYVEEVIDDVPVISKEIFELAQWLARTTLSPFISCLNSMLPKVLKTSRKITSAKTIARFHKNEGLFDLTPKQKQVYDSLYEGIEAAQARKLSASIIRKLQDLGAIEEYRQEASFVNQQIEETSFKTLTVQQQKAYDAIIAGTEMVYLLFGVTGSGKTEVYLHLARHYLAKGRNVLILVPEISLTPQMIERVKQRFSDVIFYHSELSDQERYEQYKRVMEGDVKIVVGTRSSIFLPFADLGLIIIDEEHDTSYKQDTTPCYHVRNVAFKRAHTHGAKVLLASATPSLDSYSRALKGEYRLLELKDRINHSFPQVELIDMAKQLRSRDSYIISKPLHQQISEVLSKHKQVIILLNRRGYSPIIKCLECGTTLLCQDCDTPLNYHKDENILKCHQCGRIYPRIDVCPKCGKKSIVYYGFGTKRVEEDLHERFPEAAIERMDRDNVSRKGAHEAILKRFERHEIDILIGTQMIAKGLDYPDVTLVGILNADSGLMHQDYNSAKMTFDLLMQAAGRSGRADDSGKVLIQAFNIDHYAIKAVVNQDFRYFYNIEMNYRSKASYPPYSHIMAVYLTDEDTRRIERSKDLLVSYMEDLPYRHYRPCELGKLKKQIRYRILIIDKDLKGMLEAMQVIVDSYLKEKGISKIRIDIDPLYLE